MQWRGADLFLELRVQPKASRRGIGGPVAGRIKVGVHAPPIDDAANREIVALIAKELGVAKSNVTIVAGHAGRDKRVRVCAPKRRPGWLGAAGDGG